MFFQQIRQNPSKVERHYVNHSPSFVEPARESRYQFISSFFNSPAIWAPSRVVLLSPDNESQTIRRLTFCYSSEVFTGGYGKKHSAHSFLAHHQPTTPRSWLLVH